LFLNEQKTGAPELTQRQEELFKQEFEKLSRSVNAVFVQKIAEQEKTIKRQEAELKAEIAARNKPPLPPSEEHFHVERSVKDINMLFSELQTGRTTIKNLKEKVDTLNTKVLELRAGHEHMDELRQKAEEVDEKIRVAEEKAEKQRAKQVKEAEAKCAKVQAENEQLRKELDKIKKKESNRKTRIGVLEQDAKDKDFQNKEDQEMIKNLKNKLDSVCKERDEARSKLAKRKVIFF